MPLIKGILRVVLNTAYQGAGLIGCRVSSAVFYGLLLFQLYDNRTFIAITLFDGR
jgi:hypothetical protein